MPFVTFHRTNGTTLKIRAFRILPQPRHFKVGDATLSGSPVGRVFVPLNDLNEPCHDGLDLLRIAVSEDLFEGSECAGHDIG